MDYKYIEQLIERYWQCETTLQEEAILRAFFSQPDIPESLRQYQALFTNELQKEEPLGEDFDARILEQIGETPKANIVTLKSRLMPLFRAAAIVACSHWAMPLRHHGSGDGMIQKMPTLSSIRRKAIR